MIKGIRPAMAEAGKIKIGGLGEERPTRSGNGTWRPPVKLDHFIITAASKAHHTDDLEPDTEIMGVLEALYQDQDGKVRNLPIILHSDKIDEVFPTSYVLYQGRVLGCRGDGETAERREIVAGKATGRTKPIQCPCPYLEPIVDGERRPQCKPHGTLHCSLNIPGLAVAGAVYKWRTTGIVSIQRMIGSLEQIKAVTGTLQGVPLTLCVRPVTVSPGGRATTIYACHVELRASDLLGVQRTALEARQVRAQLTAPSAVPYADMVEVPGVDEPPEVSAAVAAEFHPVDHEVDRVVDEAVDAATTAKVADMAKAAAGEAAPSAPADDDLPDYGEPDR